MRKLLALLIICPILSFGQAKMLFRKAEQTKVLSAKVLIFSEVIKLEPKNLDAYFYRAIAKHELGDYSGAIVDYSKIIFEEPDADTYLNRGNSRYSLGDFELAKLDYAKAFELDKNLINAKYSLGCVKYDIGDYNDAYLDFNSIIQNHLSKHYNAYLPLHVYKSLLMRALIYEALGNSTKAIQDYSSLILIEPNAKNYYNRGKLLIDLKFYEEANKDLNKSLSLKSNNAYAYFYKGASNLYLGKYLKAISDFTKAINSDSLDFDAYLGLAITYNIINDPNNAKLNFEKANNILLPAEKLKSIQQYKNTFWYQNKYFFFNKHVTELVKLK